MNTVITVQVSLSQFPINVIPEKYLNWNLKLFSDIEKKIYRVLRYVFLFLIAMEYFRAFTYLDADVRRLI